MGGIDLVLVMVLVMFGVPFSAWIGGLSKVVEDVQGWFFILCKYFSRRLDYKPGQELNKFFNCI